MRTLFLPPTYQDSAESGRLILRDGSVALIRVSTPDDRDALRQFFHGLSPESKRRRFFSIADPPESLLARLCDSSDPRSQLTLIVTRVVGGVSRIIATASYIARDETSAEVAFAVEDEFQGKGLGGLLLERLALLAVGNGIVRFWALTRAENQLMLETFRTSGFPIHTRTEEDCVEIDFSLAPSEDSANRSETRDRVFTTASLRPVFRPRAVALLGISSDPGRRLLDALVAGGFGGPICAVGPEARQLPSTPRVDVSDRIPPGTDLAIVSTPRDEVLSAVDECAEAGVRALIVATGGFAETDADAGALQDELVGRARDRGMRLIGPGSVGLINTDPDVRLNASLFPSLPRRGGLAMSSQSGGLGLVMLELAEQRRLGVSTFIGVGDKADISGNDLLQYWQGDESTRVILLYLESFGNPRRFARIARTVSRVKPIVVVKAGRRVSRARASEDQIPPVPTKDGPVDALFRQTGVIRAETLEEMFDIAAALDRQPLPAGRRVAILSDAAGPGTVCADACRSAGLSLPEISGETAGRIEAFFPGAMAIANPLELPSPSPPETYRRALELLLAAQETDALIAIHAGLGGELSTDLIEGIGQTVASARAAGAVKPVLACLLVPAEARWPLAGAGVPVYAFPESAAAVLGKIATYGIWRAGPHGTIPAFEDIDPTSARATCRHAIERRGAGWLSPQEAAAVLSAFGIPVVPAGPGEAVEEGTEVRVNMFDDPSFGPLILFGLGGAHVEAIDEASVRVTPLTDRAAAAMVREIRGYPLLQGYRGRPPADVEALHDLLLRVSRLVEEVPEIAELELSPVFAQAPGEGCRIAGARIRVALPRKGQAPRYTTATPERTLPF